MPVKCQSNQIFTEHYHYTMGAGENIFLPVKARPGEVLIVHSVGIYNPTANGFTHIYKILNRKGHNCRIEYVAALATLTVRRWSSDVYLIDGDECGIALTPSAAGDMVILTVQGLRFRDDEYFIST